MKSIDRSEIVPGSSSTCPECQDSYNIRPLYDDETDVEETNEAMEERFHNMIMEQEVIDEGVFSREPCDLCNSYLGGNRYIAHQLIDNVRYHIEMCVDCLLLIGGMS